MAVSLDRELAVFQRLLPSLMKEEGKFALIVGDELVGVFENRRDALLVGYQKATFGPFLVKRISGSEPTLRFTRDFQGKWHTLPPQSVRMDPLYKSRSE